MFISLVPCKFSKILEQNFSHCADKLLSLHIYLISPNLKIRQKWKYLTVSKTHRPHRGTYSKVQLCQISRLTLKITPGMPKCHYRILFHFVDVLWAAIHCDYRTCANFLPKEWSSQKYLKKISWVISGTSSSKLSCNPHHPSQNISWNHRHHLRQPSWRRIFSTLNNQKSRVDSDINGDCKASSFDRQYIWCRKWDTGSFVRAHQWKCWNALTVGRGH